MQREAFHQIDNPPQKAGCFVSRTHLDCSGRVAPNFPEGEYRDHNARASSCVLVSMRLKSIAYSSKVMRCVGSPESVAALADLCIGEGKIKFPLRAVTGPLPAGGNEPAILTEHAVEAL